MISSDAHADYEAIFLLDNIQSMKTPVTSPSMMDSYGNPGILSQNEGGGLTVKLSVNPSTSTS